MANIISFSRIIFAICLIFCPPFSLLFFIFYTAGYLSDVIDGTVARKTNSSSLFGERLDTIADTVFTITVLAKIIIGMDFPIWLFVSVSVIMIIKIVNIISGFIIYKKYIAMHTILNKICGVLIFTVPFAIKLLPRSFTVYFLIFVCLFSAFSAIEEGYRIYNKKINA